MMLVVEELQVKIEIMTLHHDLQLLETTSPNAEPANASLKICMLAELI